MGQREETFVGGWRQVSRLLEPVGVEPQGAASGERGGVTGGGGRPRLLDDQLTVL